MQLIVRTTASSTVSLSINCVECYMQCNAISFTQAYLHFHLILVSYIHELLWNIGGQHGYLLIYSFKVSLLLKSEVLSAE